jgi:hypothetical protein
MPLMAKTTGVTSTKQQLLMNALQSPIMTTGTLLGIRFIDIAGKNLTTLTFNHTEDTNLL